MINQWIGIQLQTILDVNFASSTQGSFITNMNAGQQYYIIIKEDDGTLSPMAGTVSGAGNISISAGSSESSVTLTYVDTDTLDECGLGTITRTWTATDCAGNSRQILKLLQSKITLLL